MSNPAEAYLKIRETVREAQAANKPVVAFETTVLSYGLPYPHNLTVGRQMEEIARQRGSQPATLGIVNGEVRVGLSDNELEGFCKPEPDAVKVNLQNMAATIVRGKRGSLTVAGCMQVCSLGGIEVVATGGVGGIHHDYERFHDESSDLTALARYPVAVVCSGVKSVLDVPATLERLETLGVPVIGYRTEKFPLFHSRESVYDLEVRAERLSEAARMIRKHWELGGRGVLLATPIPEEHAVDPNELQEWLDGAHRAAEYGRVSGRRLTPFLLQKMEELSQGRSLRSNVALLENNAIVGARLARKLNALKFM